MHKRKDCNIEVVVDLVQDLALCELVEFHAPLAFMLLLAVAFYGPNATLFGNIGNSYWTFSAIENIDETINIYFSILLQSYKKWHRGVHGAPLAPL